MTNQEIDIFIAQYVMKEPLIDVEIEPARRVTREMALDAGEPAMEGMKWGEPTYTQVALYEYSSSNAVWLVVKKMSELGFSFELVSPDGIVPVRRTARFWYTGPASPLLDPSTSEIFLGREETIEKAICVAALKAMGIVW